MRRPVPPGPGAAAEAPGGGSWGSAALLGAREAVSLRALTLIDPAVERIVASNSYVSVYVAEGGGIELSGWNRAGIEGPLHLVRRRSPPAYRLFVLNQRQANHLVEDLTDRWQVQAAEENYVFCRILEAARPGPPPQKPAERFLCLWMFNPAEVAELAAELQSLVADLAARPQLPGPDPRRPDPPPSQDNPGDRPGDSSPSQRLPPEPVPRPADPAPAKPPTKPPPRAEPKLLARARLPRRGPDFATGLLGPGVFAHALGRSFGETDAPPHLDPSRKPLREERKPLHPQTAHDLLRSLRATQDLPHPGQPPHPSTLLLPPPGDASPPDSPASLVLTRRTLRAFLRSDAALDWLWQGLSAAKASLLEDPH